jgi:hypothetical protein
MPKLADKSFTDLYLKNLSPTASAGTISTRHCAGWAFVSHRLD